MKKLDEAYREALETLGWEHDGPEDVGVFTMASGKMLEAWATSKNCKKPGWAPFGLFARWLSTGDGLRIRDTVAKAAIVRSSYYCNDGVELESLREYLGRFACLAVFFLLERRGGDCVVDWARELIAAQVGCEADSLLDLVMRTPVVVGPFAKEEAAKMMEKMEAKE